MGTLLVLLGLFGGLQVKATVPEPSKYMKVLKTVLNFQYEGQTRGFQYKAYGSQENALVAAKAFETEIVAVKRDFDQVRRKPDARLAMLLDYDWPKDQNHKRNLDDQLGFIIRKLCAGKMNGVEGKIHQAVVRHSLGDLAENYKVFISLAKDGFKATFSGGSKVVEQTFPSVGAAASWLASIVQAQKD